MFFRGNQDFQKAVIILNQCSKEFTSGLSLNPVLKRGTVEIWVPPRLGWWKINFDATFANRKAAVAVVFRDGFELIVKDVSKTIMASSAMKPRLRLLSGLLLWRQVKNGRTSFFLLILLKLLRRSIRPKIRGASLLEIWC